MSPQPAITTSLAAKTSSQVDTSSVEICEDERFTNINIYIYLWLLLLFLPYFPHAGYISLCKHNKGVIRMTQLLTNKAFITITCQGQSCGGAIWSTRVALHPLYKQYGKPINQAKLTNAGYLVVWQSKRASKLYVPIVADEPFWRLWNMVAEKEDTSSWQELKILK